MLIGARTKLFGDSFSVITGVKISRSFVGAKLSCLMHRFGEKTVIVSRVLVSKSPFCEVVRFFGDTYGSHRETSVGGGYYSAVWWLTSAIRQVCRSRCLPATVHSLNSFTGGLNSASIKWRVHRSRHNYN